MGPQSDGGYMERHARVRGAEHRADKGRTRENLEDGTGGLGAGRDSADEVERLAEHARRSCRAGGEGLTGLGIRVPVLRSRSFLSFDDDDDEDEDEDGNDTGFDTSDSYRRARNPQISLDDKSDNMSISSACTDIDLSPLVNAFPTPPSPRATQNTPTSIIVPVSPHRIISDRLRSQVEETPSDSTLSSDFPLVVAPARTQTASQMISIDVAVPRPNAAALRRVRSSASAVSVYFSPDRPPALPLPSLPVVDAHPSTLASARPHGSRSANTDEPVPLVGPPGPKSFSPDVCEVSAPSHSENRRSPLPSNAPPDRPLPALPSPPLQKRTTARLVAFPSRELRVNQLERPDVPTPPIRSSKCDTPILTPDEGRPRSIGSYPSNPTMEENSSPMQVYPLAAAVFADQARTRVESTTSAASLDITQISQQLDRLASQGSTEPCITSAKTTLVSVEETAAASKTEKEEDRERVRRLISRVSSVIEMRKMSGASSSGVTTISRTASDSIGGARTERNRYKAYKLTRRTSLSPSHSFQLLAGGRSPPERQLFESFSTNRSRTSSFDSDSGSSASEELFDLSFDSQLLSPSSDVGSSVTLQPNSSPLSPRGGRSPREESHIRRSQVPPRWAGRRRSSETTIEEDEAAADDRSKRIVAQSQDQLSHRDATLRAPMREEACTNEGDDEHRNDPTPVTGDELLRPSLARPLRSFSSVPVLRRSSQLDYWAPLSTTHAHPSPRESGPETTGLETLIGHVPVRARAPLGPPKAAKSSFTPTPASENSRMPASPQFSDPFAALSSPPATSLRKSSLPVPCPFPKRPPSSFRRPTPPAALVYSITPRPHESLPAAPIRPEAKPSTSKIAFLTSRI